MLPQVYEKPKNLPKFIIWNKNSVFTGLGLAKTPLKTVAVELYWSFAELLVK